MTSKIRFWKILSDAFATYRVIFLPLTLFMLLYVMVQGFGSIFTVNESPWMSDSVRAMIKIGSLVLSLFCYIIALRVTIQATDAQPLDTKEAITFARKKFLPYIGMSLYTTWYILKWAIIPLFLAFILLNQVVVPAFVGEGLLATLIWLAQQVTLNITNAAFAVILAAAIILMIIRAIRAVFAPYAFVQDEKGMKESVETSIALTKNHWWITFGCVFLMNFLANSIAAHLINRIFETFLGTQGSAIEVTYMITRALAGGIIMVFTAYLYRAMKK